MFELKFYPTNYLKIKLSFIIIKILLLSSLFIINLSSCDLSIINNINQLCNNNNNNNFNNNLTKKTTNFISEQANSYSSSSSSSSSASPSSQSQDNFIIRRADFVKSLKLQEDIFTEEQFKHIDGVLINRVDKQGKFNLSEFAYVSILVKSVMAPYSDFQFHRYDNFEDLKISGGPKVNQELCLKQLELILKISSIEKSKKYSSKLVEIQDLLDSYGRTPSGLMNGELIWPGSYKQCLNVKLDFNKYNSMIKLRNDETISSSRKINFKDSDDSTRYCFASLRFKDWPNKKPYADYIAIKTGVCLPKACDSINYKNKYDLIRKLMDYNLRDIDKENGFLNDLYCLPDEESPLRLWYYSFKTVLTIIFLAIWLTILIYSTIMHSLNISKEIDIDNDNINNNNADEKRKNFSKIKRTSFSMTNGFEKADEDDDYCENQVDNNNNNNNNNVVIMNKKNNNIELLKKNSLNNNNKNDQLMKIYESLSIINNFKLLFNVTKESSLLKETSSSSSSSSINNDKRKNSIDELNELDNENYELELEIENIKKNTKIIDLSILEGIKVISCCYVVMGHILMFAPIVLKDGYEFLSNTSPAFYIANMAPAFSVNAFFTMTGLLTSYLLLKQKKSLTDPLKWVALIVYRYLRIMPMYIVVVLYAKYLAKYASSGPFWDYSTSILAHRKNCEQESWAWVLLFGANFKSPLKHAIISAWYLCNDFQFFLITPFFMILLFKRPKIGELIIKLSILLGYFAGFTSIYNTELKDLRPIASFQTHGFTTYITFLHSNYTQPQNRIPAYLCGLLFGFALFKFEQDKINFMIEKLKWKFNNNKNNHNEDEFKLKEPNWSETFIKWGSTISFSLILFCVLQPVIATKIRFNKFYARLAVAIAMPLYHIFFSLAVGFYVLLASTGFGNKNINSFLSLKVFKALARLCLCVVLINMDVIVYIIQSMHTTQNIDTIYHFSLNCYCIFVIYIIATILCVLFEAPLRALLNQLLAHLIAKMSSKSKSKSKEKEKRIRRSE